MNSENSDETKNLYKINSFEFNIVKSPHCKQLQNKKIKNFQKNFEKSVDKQKSVW